MQPRLELYLNAILVGILCTILLGALCIQLFLHEVPCALCLLQRIGMLGVALGALLNIRFGMRPMHYGVALLSAVFGAFVALRQIALHVCPEFPPFGKPFWGLSLYTWSFLVFACSIAYIALLQLFFDRPQKMAHTPTPWIYWAGGYCLLIALVNTVTTFFLCGFGPC